MGKNNKKITGLWNNLSWEGSIGIKFQLLVLHRNPKILILGVLSKFSIPWRVWAGPQHFPEEETFPKIQLKTCSRCFPETRDAPWDVRDTKKPPRCFKAPLAESKFLEKFRNSPRKSVSRAPCKVWPWICVWVV